MKTHTVVKLSVALLVFNFFPGLSGAIATFMTTDRDWHLAIDTGTKLHFRGRVPSLGVHVDKMTVDPKVRISRRS